MFTRSISFGSFMISGSSLSCIHWLEFVYRMLWHHFGNHFTTHNITRQHLNCVHGIILLYFFCLQYSFLCLPCNLVTLCLFTLISSMFYIFKIMVSFFKNFKKNPKNSKMLADEVSWRQLNLNQFQSIWIKFINY